MIAPKVGHMDVELLITSAGPSRLDMIIFMNDMKGCRGVKV